MVASLILMVLNANQRNHSFKIILLSAKGSCCPYVSCPKLGH